jgi:hypothetical protein
MEETVITNNKNRRRRGRRRRRRRDKLANFRISDFTDVRTFPLENLVQVRLKSDPYILSISNSTSTFSADTLIPLISVTLDSTSSNIKSGFQQYRYVAARCTVTPLTDMDGCSSFGFVYATVGTASGLADAAEMVLFKNSNKANNPRYIHWKISDYVNAEWVDKGATPASNTIQFCSYTSNSDYGTPTNSSGSSIKAYRLQFWIYCELRGLAD